MIKYVDYQVTFAEVPDEVSLAFSISNCPGRCKGCHSPELRENIGRDLLEDLPVILQKYSSFVTCVTFLGEGNDLSSLKKALDIAKAHGLKTCVYYGRDEYTDELPFSDYVKIGHYDAQYGGLSDPLTNQRFYQLHHKGWEIEFTSLTHKFWKKKEEIK